MNTMTRIRESATQKDLLKHANFEPVFDEGGNIVGLRELKVSTDRRRGMDAMRELYASVETGDDLLDASGWTGKQKRILRQPAPAAAHYLKPTQKWDARAGMMRDGATILLPFEVVWTMFELLFEGQSSIKVIDHVFESEEVNPVGNDHKGDKAEDAPGRRFYARATVQITIHLGNGQQRTYEGVGVSYGEIGMERIGNVYAINSARRTAEKGAVADAKREAISNIGPVFRRAFEDGDEMIEHIENLLMDEIRERNKPAIHRVSATKAVPPPQRPKPATAPEAQSRASSEDAEKTESESAPEQDEAASTPEVAEAPVKENRISISIPNAPDRLVAPDDMPGALIDIIFETCATRQDGDALLAANAGLINESEARAEIEGVVAALEGGEEADSIPDFDIPGETGDIGESEAAKPIDVTGKSGKKILDELEGLLKAAKTNAEKDAIISANGGAIRKLTPKQMQKLTDIRHAS